jgi:hypothetical protein
MIYNPEQIINPDITSDDYDPNDTKQRLLALLPSELQERWEEATIEEIARVINKRQELGLKRIIGYHVSGKEYEVGDYIIPDKNDNGECFYSDSLESLYGRHGGGYIYVIEGTGHDKVIDDALGWRTTKGKMKIIDKIKIAPDSMKKLGAKFADCEYH